MPPKDYGRRETYYQYRQPFWNPNTPAINRLREDMAEQALEESRLIEAKMVLAYIMQKR
jgi:hypothetical protein